MGFSAAATGQEHSQACGARRALLAEGTLHPLCGDLEDTLLWLKPSWQVIVCGARGPGDVFTKAAGGLGLRVIFRKVHPFDDLSSIPAERAVVMVTSPGGIWLRTGTSVSL